MSLLAPSLRSALGTTDRLLGAADVSVLDEQLYILVAGGGVAHGNPRVPNGVYRLDSEAGIELVAGLSGWHRANPAAAASPLDYDPDGQPTSMTVVGEELWVVETNGGQILRIAVDGTIGRVVDLSATRLELTEIISSPSGGAFVATMGTMPPVDRAAKVMEVTPDGTFADV